MRATPAASRKQPAAAPADLPNRRSRPRRRRFWALLLATTLPAVGAYAYLQWWPRELSGRLERRLDECRDGEAAGLVAQLESCGLAGVGPRVRLLASRRADVADAAKASLNRTLRNLAEGDAPVAEAELTAMSEALEQLVRTGNAGIAPTASAWAWDVLEFTGRLSLDARLPLEARSRLALACNELLQRPTIAAPVSRSEKIAELAATTAIPEAPAAAPSIIETSPPAAESTSMQPTMTPQLVVAPVVENRNAANTAARVQSVGERRMDEEVEQTSTASTITVVQPRPSPGLTIQTDSSLAAQTAWSLFAALSDDVSAREANDELRRRGFSAAEIDLGKHLTSADAAERLHYARQLPSLAGSSLKPWLLHLAADPDAEVRLACLAIMATNQDPAVQARVRDLAFTDGDERVREIATRALDPNSRRR